MACWMCKLDKPLADGKNCVTCKKFVDERENAIDGAVKKADAELYSNVHRASIGYMYGLTDEFNIPIEGNYYIVTQEFLDAFENEKEGQFAWSVGSTIWFYKVLKADNPKELPTHALFHRLLGNGERWSTEKLGQGQSIPVKLIHFMTQTREVNK
jgi:hypothetical protein